MSVISIVFLLAVFNFRISDYIIEAVSDDYSTVMRFFCEKAAVLF